MPFTRVSVILTTHDMLLASLGYITVYKLVLLIFYKFCMNCYNASYLNCFSTNQKYTLAHQQLQQEYEKLKQEETEKSSKLQELM